MQHIYQRPDTYIGGKDASMQEHFVLTGTGEEAQIKRRRIQFVPGLFSIFEEIAVNASDQFRRCSKDENLSNVTYIHFTINEDDSITIKNDGHPIPQSLHAETKMSTPELIFGTLLSGENYDDTQQRTTGGRNGYGAKLTNLFSLFFKIVLCDGTHKYTQVWDKRDTNMDNAVSTSTMHIPGKKKPSIRACKSKPYTEITFLPNYAYFGLTTLPQDMKQLFRRRAYDLAGICGSKLRVKLDGETIRSNTFAKYCRLYGNQQQVVAGTLQSTAQHQMQVVVALQNNDDLDAQCTSFVNGIHTINGGTHQIYALNKLLNELKKQPHLKKNNITNGLLKKTMVVFVSADVINPTFNSQLKHQLTTPIKTSYFRQYQLPEPHYDSRFVKKVYNLIKSEVDVRLASTQRRQLERSLIGRSKMRRNQVRIPKLEDANLAGTAKSQRCTLFLTEGDSAKTFVMSMRLDRKIYGVFPLRGKPLNVRDAKPATVMKNKEIAHICQALNLSLNQTYASEQEFRQLRYGSVCICADADLDGHHICGLILNMFASYWPRLLERRDFLRVFVTPIVQCTVQNRTHSFYDEAVFAQFLQEQTVAGKKMHIKYYKGLGTWQAKDARAMAQNIQQTHMKHFATLTTTDAESLDMVFRKSRADDRKKWLMNCEVSNDDVQFLGERKSTSAAAASAAAASPAGTTIESFVHHQLKDFSQATLKRAIPHILDGLKPTQRKVLYFLLSGGSQKEQKVFQLTGRIAAALQYHHGNQSLNATIINLAQDYMGSNNINLLAPIGQFGTRLKCGKDAASERYISTKLANIAPLIFRPEDLPLLEKCVIDGQTCEPIQFYPIIPMVLVNGCAGIATGFSTQIPPHNPRDVIANLKCMLQGESPQSMIPFFNHFKGTVQEIDGGWICEGTYERLGSNSIRVTELPPGVSTDGWIEKLQQVGAASTGEKRKKPSQLEQRCPNLQLTCNHTDVAVDITITELPNDLSHDEIVALFSLSAKLSTRNMHLWRSKDQLQKFNSIQNIMTVFYHERLAMYARRKEYVLARKREKNVRLQQKIRFIRLVLSDQIQLRQRTTLIKEQMVSHGFTAPETKQFLALSLTSLSEDEVEELQRTIAALTAEIAAYEATAVADIWLSEIHELERVLP